VSSRRSRTPIWITTAQMSSSARSSIRRARPRRSAFTDGHRVNRAPTIDAARSQSRVVFSLCHPLAYSP
jgi:hypothetical protein